MKLELNKRYGWSNLIVVSRIAIREGAYKYLKIMVEHFLQDYGKRARFFIYNSKAPHNPERFSPVWALTLTTSLKIKKRASD